MDILCSGLNYMRNVPFSLLSGVMDELPYDILVIGPTGIIDFANRHFLETVGASAEQVISHTLEEFPVMIAPWKDLEEYLSFVRTETEMDGELSYAGKDGSPRWGYVNMLPVRDETGTLCYFLLANVDITARISAEDALKKSESRFRSIVQNINEYIYSVEYIDGSPGRTYHSPRCLDVTGFSPVEFDRDPNLWLSMIYPEDRPKVTEFLDNINTPFQMSYIEHRIIHKRGAIRWVSNSCALHRDLNGVVLRMDGFIQDITTRKDTVEQMRKLSLAIEQSPSTVLITDKTGTIEYVNPKFSRLTGYAQSEAVGKNPRILKSGLMQPDTYADMWKTIRAGNEWKGEFLNRKKSGELYWESASISPLKNSRREITHFIAVKEDITERKKAEAALRESEEQLRRRNETMEEDLKYAQAVQRALLPSSPPEHDRLLIRYRFLPLDMVGGDYFSFFQNDHRIGVFIGDVSGHGVSAALFSSLLRFATEKIAEESGTRPAEFLESINHVMCRNMSSYFLTAIYGFFDITETGILFRFANGGHPPLIVYRTKERRAQEVTGKGSILGFFEENVYEDKSVALEPGDRVFLYTDGIPETKNADNQIVGFDEMPSFVEKAYDEDLDVMLDNILAQAEIFRGETPIDDDIVLIGVEIR